MVKSLDIVFRGMIRLAALGFILHLYLSGTLTQVASAFTQRLASDMQHAIQMR